MRKEDSLKVDLKYILEEKQSDKMCMGFNVPGLVMDVLNDSKIAVNWIFSNASTLYFDALFVQIRLYGGKETAENVIRQAKLFTANIFKTAYTKQQTDSE